MLDVLIDLMDAAARQADYADARHVHALAELVRTHNGGLDGVERSEEEGFGVRVRVGGAWGFAAARGGSKKAAEGALARALEVARAQPSTPGGALALEPVARGRYESPAEIDPFEAPLERKLDTLLAADSALRSEGAIALSRADFRAFREHKAFASTEGSACEQVLTECGGGVAATAVDEDHSQIRSYPASHGGHVSQGGLECFEALDLPGVAPRMAEEAVALLSAPPCPSGPTTLILGGEQLGIQIHESIGHALELDRVLGREASYAGTSYADASAIGSLRVGSQLLNVTADSTTPTAVGSFRWDDEGVSAQSVPLIREGVVRGFLSSRETAAETGLERSAGCMRAEGFARQPIVRMTNVSLDPGAAGTLDDLVADTDSGVLVETNRSWSIDSRRLQFRFEGEAAWEIRRGRRTRLLRNPSYAGVTPEFWGKLDAVCSEPEWRLWSVLFCGKGEPGQSLHVSHGCAPARFSGVEVGVA